MKRRLGMLSGPIVAIFALAVGCGGDDNPVEDDGGGGDGGQPPAVTEDINIMADTNRDGVVDEFDNEGEELWTVDKGAIFLPNLDDDNLDGLQDRDTPENDGEADTIDFAIVNIGAFTSAPDTALGRVTIDPWAMPHVKVHKFTEGVGWQLVGGSDGPCGAGGDMACNFAEPFVYLTAAEVQQGVVLAVEGKRLAGLRDSTSPDPSGPQVAWSGLLQLDYSVFETPESPSPITTETSPTGVDAVQMRVSSWQMYHNLTPQLDTVMSYAVNSNASLVFQEGVDIAVADHGAKAYYKVTDFNDQWNEDWLITGWVSMPKPDGQVHGMRLAYPRAYTQANKFPIEWLSSASFAGVDHGYFVTYSSPTQGNTYDSGGNHDALPPYENPANGQSYPVGRIIYGSGVIQETKDFYEAQLPMTPAISVDTSWLIVGHIDEVLSYAPANTERGWKLLVGQPDLAVQMLTDWQGQGNGAAVMFEGKFWSNNQPAAISIDEALADTNIMAWSQQGQAEIDAIEAQVMTEVGLTQDDIVYFPFLFESLGGGALVALNPGTVNSYFWDQHVIMPDPFGPPINGVDGFKQDLLDRIGTGAEGLGVDGQGLNVFFTDNWDLYHRLLGEVHCGTNFWGPPAASEKWWEAAQ